jgi:hypothetical protein
MKPGSYIKDRVEALMTDGKERTYFQIIEELDSCLPAVRNAVKAMHAAQKAHIVGWIYNRSCHHTPIFKFGKGNDVPQREPLTRSERMRLYRKSRADRERKQKLEESRFSPISRDPLTVALFGPCKQLLKPSGSIQSRVYQQPMTIDDDELAEAA